MSPPERGGQLERTALAWQRTSLLVAVNGALLTGAVPQLGPVAAVLGGAVIATAVLIWLAASLGYRRSRGRRAPGVLAAHARATRALTALIIVIGAVNVVAVLLHR